MSNNQEHKGHRDYTHKEVYLCSNNIHNIGSGKIKVGGLCLLFKKERPHHLLNVTKPWGLFPLPLIPLFKSY